MQRFAQFLMHFVRKLRLGSKMRAQWGWCIRKFHLHAPSKKQACFLGAPCTLLEIKGEKDLLRTFPPPDLLLIGNGRNTVSRVTVFREENSLSFGPNSVEFMRKTLGASSNFGTQIIGWEESSHDVMPPGTRFEGKKTSCDVIGVRNLYSQETRIRPVSDLMKAVFQRGIFMSLPPFAPILRHLRERNVCSGINAWDFVIFAHDH